MRILTLVVLSILLLFSCAEEPLYKGSKNYQQALELYKAGKYEEAQETTQRIQSSSSNPSELAHAYLLQGYIHHKQDSMKLAYHNFKEAKTYFLALNDELYISKAYNRLGRIFYELGSYAKASDYYQEASKYSKSTLDTKQIINDLLGLGKSKKRLEHFEEALKNFYEARTLAQEIEDLNKFLNIQLEIGIVQRLAGNLHLAIEDYWLVMNSATGTSYESVMKAKCYNNLGSAYLEKEDYEKAKEYLEKSLTYSSLPDAQVAVTYNNLGQISNKEEDYQMASTYFQKSVALNHSHVDLEEVIFTFNEIRSLPGINSNGDSLAYYLDRFAQITVPLVAARKKLESVDLRYELEGYDMAENKNLELSTWKYWMTISLLTAIFLSLVVTIVLLKRQRRQFNKRKQRVVDTLTAKVKQFNIK